MESSNELFDAIVCFGMKPVGNTLSISDHVKLSTKDDKYVVLSCDKIIYEGDYNIDLLIIILKEMQHERECPLLRLFADMLLKENYVFL
jgi:hypothetical protein